jgi:hypothetical protein
MMIAVICTAISFILLALQPLLSGDSAQGLARVQRTLSHINKRERQGPDELFPLSCSVVRLLDTIRNFSVPLQAAIRAAGCRKLRRLVEHLTRGGTLIIP